MFFSNLLYPPVKETGTVPQDSLAIRSLLKSVGPSDEEPKMLSGEAGCADKPEDLLEVLGFPSHPRRLAMISFRLNISQQRNDKSQT